MSMKKSMKIFLDSDRTLPKLYMYMVFVESIRPILFACKDEEEKLYICSCHCANADKCEWVIAPTTYTNLIELLTNTITIRDVFIKDNTSVYVATLLASTKEVTVQKTNKEEIAGILPSADYYMEAEPDEFEYELNELRAEEQCSTDFVRIRFQNSFNTAFKSFSVSLSCSLQPTIMKSPNYLSSNQKLSFMVP